MRDFPDASKGSGFLVLKTESDFFDHIEKRMKQEGFEILDLFGSSQGERPAAPLALQEGA